MSSPALNPLVTKIRAAHPGAYDDLDDATLTKRVLAKYPQYSDLAAPPAAGPHVDMQERNIFDDPNTVGKPSRGIAPAGKLTGLPGVNPHEPSYKEGVGDTMLAGGPLAATSTIPRVALGLAGGAAGGALAERGAEAAGLGPTGRELAETGGQVIGGGVGAKSPELARPTLRGVGRVATTVGGALDNNIVGTFRPGLKNAGGLLRGVGGIASKLGAKPPEPVYPGASLPEHPGIFPGASLPEAPAPEVIQARSLEGIGRKPQAAALGRIPQPQPSTHDIPEDEWQAGHEIAPQVENSPKQTLIAGESGAKPLGKKESLTSALKKSVKAVKAKKSAAAGD